MDRRQLLGRAVLAAGAGLAPGLGLRAQAPVFDSDPFMLGVASGYPTASSFVIWTRLAPAPLLPSGGIPPVAVPVTWELAADPGFARVLRRGEAVAGPALAHSVHVEVGGLTPDRPYWYRFRSGGATSPVGRGRTLPVPGASLNALRIGVANCQHFENGHYAAFRALARDELDLILHLGDYIYENAGLSGVRSHPFRETVTLADYRMRHAMYKLDISLQQAHASAPWLVTWDDHEVDNDYANASGQDGGDPAAFLQRRAAAYQAYYEHMPLPPWLAPDGARLHLHHWAPVGDLVDICMLDGRQYRSPQACGRGVVAPCAGFRAPGRTMLGQAQEDWLAGILRVRRPRWSLLAQQTVFAGMDQREGPAVGVWYDGWSGYPAARERMVDTLVRHRVPNPVILSGDLHAFIVNDVQRVAFDPASAVVATEITTTSISSAGPSQATVDGWRRENPNVRFTGSEYRGYTRLTITDDRLEAELIAVDELADPESPTHRLASWHVLAGRPGAVS